MTGGFRPPLDLSEVMNHYSMWLTNAQTNTPMPTLDTPFQMGHGPATCSTETALQVSPLLCWDVQNYYKTMGVHWKATKKQLMVAYQQFGSMPSARQTYVFKMLLDPVMRREYDLWPLGMPFLHDQEVQAWLKKKALDLARKMSKRTGHDVSAEDVLSDWGMKIAPDEMVDAEGTEVQDDPAEPAKSPAVTPWLYAWFSWRTAKADTEVLRTWQELLVSFLSDLGARVQLAVGFAGRTDSRYVIGEVQGTKVVFISDKEDPSPALAAAAAQALLSDLHQT